MGRPRGCETGRVQAKLLSLVAAGALLAGCGGGSPASGARVHGPLIGAMFDGPALGPHVELGHELDLALASGVESVRVAFSWAAAQPSRGAPPDFSASDRIVGAAAARGMSLLPVVLYTPAWDALGAPGPGATPRSLAPFAAFLRALVARYGPDGSFWRAHPSLSPIPIRSWQVWNEPNFTRYWNVQPFAPSYVRLLTAAHAAIKAADPGASVVLAGLPNFSWEYLAEIYRVPGARSMFDVVGAHPYTATPAGVLVILHRIRTVMDRFGDASKPILATEITWPSSAGRTLAPFPIGTTEAGQAAKLNALMPLLRSQLAALRVSGFYWYTWIGDESAPRAADPFTFAGLERYVHGVVSAKPALAVFRRWALALEECRFKRARADRCG